MEKIKQSWQQLILSGSYKGALRYELARIKLFNQILLVMIALFCVFIFIAINKEKYSDLIVISIESAIAFGIYWIHKNGWRTTGRLIFNVIAPLAVGSIYMMYGPGSQIQIYFVFTTTLAVIFFDQFRQQFPILIFNLIIFSFVYINPLGIEHILSHYADRLMGYLNVTSGTFFTILIIRYFIKENIQYEIRHEATMRTLEENNKHLKDANKELETVAFIASHDLKSPLRQVISFTNLLENNVKDDESRQYMDFIKDGSLQMNLIVDDLLNYSKIRTDGTRSQTIHLKRQLEILQKTKKIESGLTLENTDMMFRGNPEYIQLLLGHLIGNGFKFNTSSSPQVRVRGKERDAHVEIEIQDNGIGIDPKYQNQIFEPFKKLHRREEYIGTGIGLALCRRIVEKMNGEIQLLSSSEQGSTFKITLPK